MKVVRVGVVGLGVISKYYLAAISANPATELAAVCDLRREALTPFEGMTACFTDHRAMLPRIDTLVVTTPNDTHEQLCREAVEAGVSVCVEKPLAIELEAGRRVAALGGRVFTAFHRRYNRNVRQLTRDLRGPGITGLTVRYLEKIEEHVGEDAWYLDAARCGGGCVADNGPNAFDLVRLFLGDVTVEDVAIKRDPAGVDRVAVVRLQAGDGTPARVELDWSYPGETKDVRVELADGTTRTADLLDGFTGFKNSLWHEYEGVLADFLGGAPDQGLAALELVDASYRREAVLEGK
ncbi:Gfo/Idh/MocA family protein [Amycolatopsis albispora]|uniref:Oxidoreductase n=1 Tax=Amycolatopsis albispora TaxID=1804986 RepID=A0A344LMA8_9PSEU|nr:Gfo/Idh/MocA family oxidoreductase [Amycolatopsis albispora]AXB49182.1 oxidoreductase [Amycolatopsis albispora]